MMPWRLGGVGCTHGAASCAHLRWRPAYFALPPPSLDRGERVSTLVLARDGSMLRGFLSADGKWRLPVTVDAVDPVYRRMLIATEDRRFEAHLGVDPLAVLRAAGSGSGTAVSSPAPRP